MSKDEYLDKIIVQTCHSEFLYPILFMHRENILAQDWLCVHNNVLNQDKATTICLREITNQSKLHVI